MAKSSVNRLPYYVLVALEHLPRDLCFPRFVIEDVLDDDEYDRLLAEFPDHLVGQPGFDGFCNYVVGPNSGSLEQLSLGWQHFIQVLCSDDSKKELVQACLKKVMRRYPPTWRWLLRSRLQNPNNYEINVAFSANYSGRYLPPHTDNSYKVLALVLYFAPRGHEGLEEGTRFFRPRSASAVATAVRRYNRLADSQLTRFAPLQMLPMTSCNIHNHCLTAEDVQASEHWFEEQFEEDVNVLFRPNRVAGFIKTQSSFHAVDMRNSTLEGPRRSLLINLNLRHSLAARLGQSFRTKVLGLNT